MQEYIKKSEGSRNTTLIISNDEMGDIVKIVKSLEDLDLLLKGVSETIQNDTKKQREGFFSYVIRHLGCKFIRNTFVRKGVIRARDSVIAKTKARSKRQGKGIVRAVCDSRSLKKNEFLMPPHPLTNFEIKKYYQNEPKLNRVNSRDNLPKIKIGEYVINCDEYFDI